MIAIIGTELPVLGVACTLAASSGLRVRNPVVEMTELEFRWQVNYLAV